MTEVWVRNYVPGEFPPIPTYRKCADVIPIEKVRQ